MLPEIVLRKKAFRRLQILHIASLAGLVSAILLLVSDGSSPAFWSPRNVLAITLAAVSGLCLVRFWRCPACGHYLENKWPKKECPSCHRVLR